MPILIELNELYILYNMNYIFLDVDICYVDILARSPCGMVFMVIIGRWFCSSLDMLPTVLAR